MLNPHTPLVSPKPLFRRFSQLFERGFRIDWITASYISVTHVVLLIGTPLAYYFAPTGFWKVMLGWTLTHTLIACISVTSYAHRLIAHGAALRIRWPVHLLFGYIGHVLAMQGSVRRWAATHVIHHSVDRTGNHHLDPYSATWFPRCWQNFLWSHLLTYFFHHPPSKELAAAYEQNSDPVLIVQDRLYVPLLVAFNYLLPFVLGIVLTGSLTGGFCLLMASVGGFILAQHNTWTVNSITHLFGFKQALNSSAKNNYVWLGPLGEGNHHADHHDYCRDYRNGFGIKGWLLDPTRYVLLALRALGGIKGLQRATKLQEVRIITQRKMREAQASPRWREWESKLQVLTSEWLTTTRQWESFNRVFKSKKLELRNMRLPKLELKQKLTALKQELLQAKHAMREARAACINAFNAMQNQAPTSPVC